MIHRIFILIGIFWTLFMVLLGLWNVKNERDKMTAITLAQARSFFKHVTTTRYWNSLHGGVYVPVTKQTQPNAFLDVPHRDVVTKDGQLLTLINPAYMTRQISEIASERDQLHFHITSLKPIRPKNAPNEWEAKTLSSFSVKMDEYYDWWIPVDNKSKFFRYMSPLWTERTCLKCHSKQGYEQGDLRGGISISIPAEHILSVRDRRIQGLLIGYLSIWMLGLSGIFISFRFIAREQKKGSRLIEELEKALGQVKTLKGLIPICSSCKLIRNDEGYWEQIEIYVRDRSDAEFTHGICPDCMKKLCSECVQDDEPDKSSES